MLVDRVVRLLGEEIDDAIRMKANKSRRGRESNRDLIVRFGYVMQVDLLKLSPHITLHGPKTKPCVYGPQGSVVSAESWNTGAKPPGDWYRAFGYARGSGHRLCPETQD
ncbi:hypothetical protein LIA77_09418 [Sarocladium implicatum]|nr:hypothetical protein LIA77_09418 [Sarocladium implicatum]